jgi:hypothetical protein
MLAILDGGGAVRASIRKYGGDKILVQRCHQHKQRNVCEHFAEDQRPYWEKKLVHRASYESSSPYFTTFIVNPLQAGPNVGRRTIATSEITHRQKAK